MRQDLWECPGCGRTVRSDPLAVDDWGDEERAIGPDCPECEDEMEPVVDGGEE